MPTTTEIFENALKTLAKKEEKAFSFPVSVDLPRSYPAVSNTMSPLALGSTAAIGATAAFPDEGESASIPASKLEASLKRALSPKTFNSIPEETMQGLKKWTGRNVTEELGYADQPATEALDSNFLAQGLASKDYLKYDPDTMIKLRQAQAVTPENTLARANLSVGFLPKDDPREGMLSVFGKNNSAMYNPQKPNFNPFKNVGHEIGGHVPQVIRMDGSFSPKLDHKLAFLNEAGENTSRILNNVPYAASLINSDFYKTAPKETQELIDFAFKVYRNSPPEVVARNMGEMYNRTLRAGDFGYLKDPENFNDIYGKFASKAYMDFTNENPETSSKILGKLKSKYALPTAAIGAYGLSGNDTPADAGLKEKVLVSAKDIDRKLISSIEEYLSTGKKFPESPSELYRGIPPGSTPEAFPSDKYTHATPWAEIAKTAGKGGFGSSVNDIYSYDVLPNTEYYRGGSLAGDPLEQTSIKSASGKSWSTAVEEAKNFYDKKLGLNLDELLRSNLKGDNLIQQAHAIEKYVMDEAIINLRNGTFETDAFGKPGIWKNTTIPSTLNLTKPRIRSNDELKKIVEKGISSGLHLENIPEYKILKASGLTTNTNSNLKPSHTMSEMSNIDKAGGVSTLGKNVGDSVYLKKVEGNVKNLGNAAFGAVDLGADVVKSAWDAVKSGKKVMTGGKLPGDSDVTVKDVEDVVGWAGNAGMAYEALKGAPKIGSALGDLAVRELEGFFGTVGDEARESVLGGGNGIVDVVLARIKKVSENKKRQLKSGVKVKGFNFDNEAGASDFFSGAVE